MLMLCLRFSLPPQPVSFAPAFLPAAACRLVSSVSHQSLDVFLNDLSSLNHEASGVPRNAATDCANERFPLKRVDDLLRHLGNPQNRMHAVHVVGSKGKGSCASLLARVFAASGHVNVGLYTSPHVLALSERVRVLTNQDDDGDVGDAALLRAFETYAPAVRTAQEEAGGAITRFEVLTCLALRYFADANVRVAVMEAGLGGVSDATNVFGGGRGQKNDGDGDGDGDVARANRVLGVLCTHVSNEHASALGGSLASVCKSKASIAASGRPFVVARQTERGVRGALVETAETAGARVHTAGTLIPSESNPTARHGFVYTAPDGRREVENVQIPTRLRYAPASHTNIEAVLALALAIRSQNGDVFEGQGKLGIDLAQILSNEMLVRGIAHWTPPRGRGEVLEGRDDWPVVVVDGAHTPESVSQAIEAVRNRRLAEAARENPDVLPSSIRVAAVVALMNDKDASGIMDVLHASRLNRVVFSSSSVNGDSSRFHAAKALYDLYNKPEESTWCDGGVVSAMRNAANCVGRDGSIVVLGSFYAGADAMRAWFSDRRL
ncbi:dihydrofolate synthase [Pseudoscourfieldia marina]